MPEIRELNISDEGFWQDLDEVLAWEQSIDGGVSQTVAEILAEVKKRGDEALLEYSRKFDRLDNAVSCNDVSWASNLPPGKATWAECTPL